MVVKSRSAIFIRFFRFHLISKDHRKFLEVLFLSRFISVSLRPIKKTRESANRHATLSSAPMNTEPPQCPAPLTAQVIRAIVEVSKTLGAGFLEKVYQG